MNFPVLAGEERGDIDAIIVDFSLDLRLGYDAEMTVSFRKRHAQAERCVLQAPVIVALPANTGPFLQIDNINISHPVCDFWVPTCINNGYFEINAIFWLETLKWWCIYTNSMKIIGSRLGNIRNQIYS